MPRMYLWSLMNDASLGATAMIAVVAAMAINAHSQRMVSEITDCWMTGGQ